jgi:hypothetical protein
MNEALDRLGAGGELARRREARLGAELSRVVAARLAERVVELSAGATYDQARADVVARQLAPWDAADQLVRAADPDADPDAL